jgi:pyruvate dehydrogenase E1 component
LREVEAAQKLLHADYGVESDVWSVTSFSELAREARALEREQALAIEDDALAKKVPYVRECLANGVGPVVVATDYVALHAEQIRPWVDRAYHVLGTDGFGRSDTRANLRAHFEVDARHIAYRALVALYQAGGCDKKQVVDARTRYHIDPNLTPPWTR